MPPIYFEPSQSSMEIVGEKKYQKGIRKVIFYKELVDKDDLTFKWENLKVDLILEDDNKYDLGNAVRVEMDHTTVGYLARDDAKEYRKQLQKLGITNEVCTCKAAVYGKRPDFGKPMFFGFWLFIELNRGLKIDETPKRKKFLGIF
jgi:hypothetical protein